MGTCCTEQSDDLRLDYFYQYDSSHDYIRDHAHERAHVHARPRPRDHAPVARALAFHPPAYT